MNTNHKIQQQLAENWFRQLRDDVVACFQQIEEEFCGKFPEVQERSWSRSGGGGGFSTVVQGHLFEKAGVNISTVHGQFSEEFAREIPGAMDNNRHFWASGTSIVCHMHSPFVPAIHMNTRMICTAKQWFGGGIDLTPIYKNDADAELFHGKLKLACDAYDPDCYEKFKKNCDEYFFLKHRNEPRGIGGIFYDYVNSGDWEKDMAFTKSVGIAFIEIYSQLVRNNMHRSWTPEEKEYQLYKRGRYVEFNLLYDRGTRFGLMTGGDTDSILMSMPPLVKW